MADWLKETGDLLSWMGRAREEVLGFCMEAERLAAKAPQGTDPADSPSVDLIDMAAEMRLLVDELTEGRDNLCHIIDEWREKYGEEEA